MNHSDACIWELAEISLLDTICTYVSKMLFVRSVTTPPCQLLYTMVEQEPLSGKQQAVGMGIIAKFWLALTQT